MPTIAACDDLFIVDLRSRKELADTVRQSAQAAFRSPEEQIAYILSVYFATKELENEL